MEISNIKEILIKNMESKICGHQKVKVQRITVGNTAYSVTIGMFK